MRAFHVIILAVFTIVACQLSKAQRFMTTSAPVEPWCQLVSSTNGRMLFAATAANAGINPVFYSTNGGAAWANANLPSGNTFSLACSADGTKVAAAMWYGPIYISTNSGVNWVKTSAPNNVWWDSIQSSRDGATLIASVWGDTIYFSMDGGQTWNPGNAPSKSWLTLTASGDGKKCFAGTAGIDPLYFSADSGKTWSPLNMPSDEWGTIACSVDGTRVFAMPFATGDPYFTSPDSGTTWATNATPNPGWNSVACSDDGRTLVAAGPNCLFTSIDSATNWNACCSGQEWKTVSCSSDGLCLLAAKTGGQILSTAIPSIPWAPTFAPLGSWACLCESSDGVRVFGAMQGGGAYVSSNAGAQWSAIKVPATNWVSVAASADMSKLVGIADNKIIQTSDSGATWHTTSAPLGLWSSVACSSNGNVLLAVRVLFGGSTAGSIYVSHDCGTNWTHPSGINGMGTASWCSADGITMFAGINGGGIYSSTNGGTNWTLTGAPSTTWGRIAASSNAVFVIATDYNATWISSNSGGSWVTSSIPASSVACSKDGVTLLAAVSQGPIYSSTNSGTTWNAANTPYENWSGLAINDRGGWIAANNADTIFTAPALPLVFIQNSVRGLSLSWACSLTNFSLQRNDSLGSSSWVTDTDPISVVNGLNNVLATTTSPASFFRLAVP